MAWFRLNELSVGSLTTTILLATITGYLLSLRRKQRDTWYLAGYLGSLFLLLLAYTVRYSVFSAAALPAGHVANLIVFGVLCLIQFAYWFGGNPNVRESRIVLAVSGAVALATWGSLAVFAGLHAQYDFEAEYFTYDFGPRISIVALLEYLWALAVFVRKARRGEPRVARSHRSFALLTLATLPIALQYVLFQTGVLSRSSYAIVFNTGSLVICLLIFIVYVNNAPRPTSFLAKLIGISLAVVMVTLGIASNALMPVVGSSIMDRMRAETRLVDSMLRTGPILKLPSDVAYLLPAPAPGGRSEAHPTYRAADPLDPRSFFIELPIVHEGARFVVGFEYAQYRRELHEFAWKLAASALAAWVLVACGFPIIFRRSLVRPLAALLDGVQQVSSGNFRASIPALSEDEIGRLANGYNRMVDSLRSMEGNFKALAENAHDAILILSDSGRIVFANARASALTGAPPNELLGSDARRFGWTAPAGAGGGTDAVENSGEKMGENSGAGAGSDAGAAASGRAGAPGRAARSYETELRRSDGSLVPVEVTTAPTRWQEHAAEVHVVRDVSERRRADEERRAQAVLLLRTEKLASLGELVASVAHEINNPNHVVSMNVRFLDDGVTALLALTASSPELGDELRIAGMSYERFTTACRAAMTDIERSAQRIDHIVGELKRFVRGSGAPRERVDVNEVVRSVVELSRPFIDAATSRFVIDLDDSLPAVLADFVELEQVALNLIENACQSLPSRERGIRVTTRREPSEVVFTVADEGRGIAREELAHLTEPLYTTRAGSGGTGLGLSITNRIVRGIGGSLGFASEPGTGTSAVVRLPIAPPLDAGTF